MASKLIQSSMVYFFSYICPYVKSNIKFFLFVSACLIAGNLSCLLLINFGDLSLAGKKINDVTETSFSSAPDHFMPSGLPGGVSVPAVSYQNEIPPRLAMNKNKFIFNSRSSLNLRQFSSRILSATCCEGASLSRSHLTCSVLRI